ncbi:MAG TPA: hypothetical protein VNT57_04635 [Desulfobacteria bacterium]|nr:hypothetical protein [Desulfobacteria bacterium]
MNTNDLIDEMDDHESNDFDFEKELAAIRKKDRRKMLFVGFVAGVMLAFGAAMYMADANANSDSYDSSYSQSENSSLGGSASYAGYSGQSAGGAGGAGGGCCGSGGSSLGNVSLSDLEKQALDKYKQEKGSASEVTAKAKSYGCHIQIDMSDKTGKIVRSYGYRGDQIYVIS